MNEVLDFIVMGFVAYLFWSINTRIRRRINAWANDNGISIVSKFYVPWHWYFPLCGGFHPANFRVTAINAEGVREIFWISGGGLLWLSDDLKIEKAP